MTSGLLDTSVVIDWHDPPLPPPCPTRSRSPPSPLPRLAAGPLLAGDSIEAARRQTRLQEVETLLEPIAFDAAAARSYWLIVAAAVHEGRRPRNRFADLLIAATAHSANNLDLYTRNAGDFAGLAGLVRVIGI